MQMTLSVLRLFKEVLIDLFEDKGLFDDDAAVMLNHECGQLGAVDEHQAGVHPLCIVDSLGAETGRGDEDSSGGLCAVQRSDESLDVRASDMLIGVALGLDVHHVKSQGIQADQPIEARIAGGAKVLGGCFQASVSHLHQQPEYELLEEDRGLLQDAGEQICRYGGVGRVDHLGDSFAGR